MNAGAAEGANRRFATVAAKPAAAAIEKSLEKVYIFNEKSLEKVQ